MRLVRQTGYALVLLGLLSLLTLTGCQHQPSKTVAYYETQDLSLSEAIRQNGAQMIQQGARLKIILPTDKFFRAQTLQVRSHQIDTLRMIAIYLKNHMNQYHGSSTITVTGYVDTVFTKNRRIALSRQYADVIASYLWNQGFSERQIRVRGAGSTGTVADPTTAMGSGANRRVEIQVN